MYVNYTKGLHHDILYINQINCFYCYFLPPHPPFSMAFNDLLCVTLIHRYMCFVIVVLPSDSLSLSPSPSTLQTLNYSYGFVYIYMHKYMYVCICICIYLVLDSAYKTCDFCPSKSGLPRFSPFHKVQGHRLLCPSEPQLPDS
jgi:hypothetical protein